MCFSCGRPGHGVNRCSQVDTAFPFLPTGWPVDVRDGKYWAMRIGETGEWSHPGNEGWSGWEGQPHGPLGIRVLLTPAGEMVDRGEARRQDNRQLPIRTKPVLGSRNAIGPDSLIGMSGCSLLVVPPVYRAGKIGGGCGLPVEIGCLLWK